MELFGGGVISLPRNVQRKVRVVATYMNHYNISFSGEMSIIQQFYNTFHPSLPLTCTVRDPWAHGRESKERVHTNNALPGIHMSVIKLSLRREHLAGFRALNLHYLLKHNPV